MRRPPPLSELPRYPAAGGLALLAIAVGILSAAAPERVEPLQMDGRAFLGEPWRVLTTVIVHGDPLHLLFNVYWLWVFGSALEKRYGSALLLVGMICCGAVTTCAEYALFSGGIGLSGIGYGLFGFCWMLAERDPRQRDLVDDRTMVTFLVWGLLCIVTTALDVLPVANVAHGMGLLLGVCAGLAVTRSWRYALACIALAALSVLGATRGRVYVNIERHRAASALAYVASKVGEEGDWARSARLYEQAVALAHEPGHETNLGYTYSKLGRYEDARVKYDRACERGEMIACSNLGILYEYGNGVPIDVEKARAYYRRACVGHNAEACKNEARYSTPAPQ